MTRLGRGPVSAAAAWRDAIEAGRVELCDNPSCTSDQMWGIKRAGGPLTNDAQWYVNACGTYTGGAPVVPFDQGMGGITFKSFWNSYGGSVAIGPCW